MRYASRKLSVVGILLQFSLFSTAGLTWNLAPAAEFTGARPQGPYAFLGNYEIPAVRVAETIQVTAPDLSRRLAERRKEGFSCYKRSRTAYLCTKMEHPTSWPAEIDQAIRSQLVGLSLDFAGPYAQAELLTETGEAREWLFREPVQIAGRKAEFFRLIERTTEGTIQLTLPVSSEQPIAWLDFRAASSTLVLHVTLNSKQGERTLGYIVDVLLERNSALTARSF